MALVAVVILTGAAITACSATVAGNAVTAPGVVATASGSVATRPTAAPTAADGTGSDGTGSVGTGSVGTGAVGTGSASTSESGISESAAPTDITDVVLDPGGSEPPGDSTPPLQDLPDMPPMGPEVEVAVDAHGVITIARGNPKVVIDEYQDPICPPCARFWEDNGMQVSIAVATGKVALRLHSVNFLDDRSASGDYSTRADASLLAIADLAGPNEVIRWQTALYSSIVQPPEDGDFDITNDELGDLATVLGMGQGVTDAVVGDDYHAKALAAAAVSYDELAKTGQSSVPATFSGGRLIDTSRRSWLTDLIGR